MIIICPNCTTKYNVQPALIGSGRSTRCYNCGHTWHQAPVVSPPPPPMHPRQPQPLAQAPTQPPPQPPPQPPMPAPAQMPPQAMAMMPGQPMAPPAQPVISAMPDAAMPMQAPAAPTPKPVARPAPAPAPEPDDPLDDFDFDGALDDDQQGDDMDAGDADNDQGPISSADLDEMFGEDDGAEAMTSIMDDDGYGDSVADFDPDDLPEPDPVPQMFSPDESDDDDDEPRKRSLGKIFTISFVILLIAGVAGLYFGRTMVMEMLPMTKEFYEKVGLGEKIGVGLNLSKPKTSYGTDKEGKSTLTIRGVITNISEVPRMVPMLKVILRDTDKRDLQTTVAPPLRNELPAGERMRYKATIVDPSPLARSIAVIFIKPEVMMQKEEMQKEGMKPK